MTVSIDQAMLWLGIQMVSVTSDDGEAGRLMSACVMGIMLARGSPKFADLILQGHKRVFGEEEVVKWQASADAASVEASTLTPPGGGEA